VNPIILAIILGLSHGIEPDHVVTARLLKTRRKILQFALAHSAGFIIIAIPLVILIGDNKILEIVADAVGIIFSILLIIETVTGKEFDIGANTAGVLQGAFVITPTKVLVIVIASSAYNLVYSIETLLAFILASSISIFSLSILNIIPKRIYKILNISIAIFTLGYLVFSLLA